MCDKASCVDGDAIMLFCISSSHQSCLPEIERLSEIQSTRKLTAYDGWE